MADFPEMIGKYKIEALVAKGGMGAVYKAVHPTLKRYVIIKKLTIRGNSAITERFKREARILLDFKNEHIVHFFDHFKEGNSHYIVLEFVDGMSLDQMIRKRRYLSSELSLVIFLDACKALKYAHDNGVIHRDIKPGNILMSKKGDIKLADFGIASSEEEDDSGLTKEGMTLGTPSYMPPEQFENTKNVDKRADVYAMGVMLYEMVTGKKPFPGNFAPDTILMIQKGRFLPAKKINPDVSPTVAKLIRKMIRPDPRKRFQDMGEVIRIIERHLKLYPVAQIRSWLVDFMNGSAADEAQYKPRARKRAFFIPILIILAGSAVLAWYGYAYGYFFRWFFPDQYGAVRVSLRIPKTVKDQDDLFLKAKLFLNDKKDVTGLADSPLVFEKTPTTDADPYYSFVSAPVFLKPGAYRVKLLAEQRLFWRSFYLEPFSRSKDPGSALTDVQIRFDDSGPRPLVVSHEAYNAVTGEAVGSKNAFYANVNGEWRNVDELEKGTLETGKVWRFRAEAEGYYPEAFSLRIGPYQDELKVSASLVPLPGTLAIDCPDGSWRLLLNGSATIVMGGEEPATGTLDGFKGGKANWKLPSGVYELAVFSGNESQTISVNVPPNGSAKIKVTVASGKLTLKREE